MWVGLFFIIESLMMIVVLGVLVIGVVEEVVLVVFLFVVGEVLEGVVVNKVCDGICVLG